MQRNRRFLLPPLFAVARLCIAENERAGGDVVVRRTGGDEKSYLLCQTISDPADRHDRTAKQTRGAKTWTRTCDTLREEVICFVRERLASSSELEQLRCYIR